MTTAAATDTMPVESIVIGARYRKEIGSLTELMKSVEEVGLLQPIVVTSDGRLLAGMRRLLVVKKLGWDEVPVFIAENVTDTARELIAERDENTCRKDMKPSEAARLGIAIEALDADKRIANREAQVRINFGKADGPKLGRSELPYPQVGRAVRDVAPAVGMSHGTYERAKRVVQAAEDETAPLEIRQAAREALEEMDRTGKIYPSWNKVNQAKKDQPEPGAYAKWDKTSDRYKNTVARIVQATWDSLQRIDVTAPKLAETDMEVLAEQLSADELESMQEMAANATTALKTFQRRLKEYQPKQEVN